MQNFAGTSAGVFIATGLVLGYTPSEIRELLSKINYLNISNIDPDLLFNYFNGLGVDDGDKLSKNYLLIKLIIEKKLEIQILHLVNYIQKQISFL